jgi:type I restriction enzyme S subunit
MSFPMVALREVVLPVERAEVPGAGTTYRQVGVKLWGVGAYERESMDGSQTRYKTLSRVEADDIIVNKIWARNGSVAVVPKTLAGCFVSSEFPTFVPIREKLEPRWFHWLTKTKSFWEKCDEKSQGTSGKNRIRPERFLEIEIPLPPFPEQRRIVARIEELAAKIDEARGLRKKAGEEIEIMLKATWKTLFKQLSNEVNPVLLDSVANIIGGGSLPEVLTEYVNEPNVLFVKVSDMNTLGNEVMIHSSAVGVDENSTLLRGVRIIKAGSIIFPKRGGAIATNKKRILAKPGALDPNLMGMSVKDVNVNKVEPSYLFKWFQGIDLASLQNGTSVPQINKADLAPLLIPIPTIEKQRRIVTYLDKLQAKVDTLRRLQAETGAEMDALMPAVLDKAFKGEM